MLVCPSCVTYFYNIVDASGTELLDTAAAHSTRLFATKVLCKDGSYMRALMDPQMMRSLLPDFNNKGAGTTIWARFYRSDKQLGTQWYTRLPHEKE